MLTVHIGSSPTSGVQGKLDTGSFSHFRGRGKRKENIGAEQAARVLLIHSTQRKRTQLNNTSFKDVFPHQLNPRVMTNHRPCQAGPNHGNRYSVSKLYLTTGVHALTKPWNTQLAKANDATSQPQQGPNGEEFTAFMHTLTIRRILEKMTFDDPVEF
ncbi:hypothetical protein Tco_0152149 [Tanacetum coccineum]